MKGPGQDGLAPSGTDGCSQNNHIGLLAGRVRRCGLEVGTGFDLPAGQLGGPGCWKLDMCIGCVPPQSVQSQAIKWSVLTCEPCGEWGTRQRTAQLKGYVPPTAKRRSRHLVTSRLSTKVSYHLPKTFFHLPRLRQTPLYLNFGIYGAPRLLHNLSPKARLSESPSEPPLRLLRRNNPNPVARCATDRKATTYPPR
jgi:hypothetical protein